MTGQITGRDPVGKMLVEKFTAEYPDETSEQIFARLTRAWRSMGGADSSLPMTADDVARWRPEVTR